MSEYLQNAWYCIGWANELENGPIGRTVLEKPMVAFKTHAGELVALGGACPHRFAPLAQGKVGDHTIACPYHGLVFDTSGQCVRNPHGPKGQGIIPPNAKVPKYAVMEKFNAIWVWPGDIEKANYDALGFFDWTCSDEYAGFYGRLRVRANYQLVIDNLLDLTHGPYLHPSTLAAENTVEMVPEFDFKTDDDNTIHSNYTFRNAPAAPLTMPVWGDNPADLYSNIRWRPASILELDIVLATPGAGIDDKKRFHQPSYHFITPINDLETNYFYASGRNLMLDDEEVAAHLQKTAEHAFGQEDEPMIRAVQEMMGTPDLMSLKPAVLASDISAMQARRVLKKMIKDEVASEP